MRSLVSSHCLLPSAPPCLAQSSLNLQEHLSQRLHSQVWLLFHLQPCWLSGRRRKSDYRLEIVMMMRGESRTLNVICVHRGSLCPITGRAKRSKPHAGHLSPRFLYRRLVHRSHEKIRQYSSVGENIFMGFFGQDSRWSLKHWLSKHKVNNN